MNQGFKINTYTKLACYSVVIFGSIILTIGTIISIFNFTKPQNHKIKYWCDETLLLHSKSQNELNKMLISSVVNIWKSSNPHP